MNYEDQLERDRQREADRLASLDNPPKYDGSRCQIADPFNNPHRDDTCCRMGTRGCILNHDASDPIPAEVLEARIAANQAARKRDG